MRDRNKIQLYRGIFISFSLFLLTGYLTGCSLQRVPHKPTVELTDTTKMFLKRHGVVFDQKLVSEIASIGPSLGAMDPSIQSYYNFLVEARELLSPYTRSDGRVVFKGTYYEHDVVLTLVTIFSLGIFGGVSDGHMKVSFYSEGGRCEDLIIRHNEQIGGWLAAPLAILPTWRFKKHDNLIEREGLVALLNDLPRANKKFLVGECSDRNRFGRFGREAE